MTKTESGKHLLYSLWRLWSPEGMGGGEELNKIPRYNPLLFYITFLTEKGPYTFYKNWQTVPLSHTNLEHCIFLTTVNVSSFKYEYTNKPESSLVFFTAINE